MILGQIHPEFRNTTIHLQRSRITAAPEVSSAGRHFEKVPHLTYLTKSSIHTPASMAKQVCSHLAVRVHSLFSEEGEEKRATVFYGYILIW